MRDEDLKSLCEHVAHGGAVTDWCTARELRYWDVLAWLNEDEERQRAWATATEHGREWLKAEVIRQLQAASTVDVRRAFMPDGSLLPLEEIPEDVARAITHVEPATDKANARVRFADRLKALELVGKTLALFTDRVDHTGRISLEELVLRSMKDAGEDA
jgi:hypothetical protein